MWGNDNLMADEAQGATEEKGIPANSKIDDCVRGDVRLNNKYCVMPSLNLMIGKYKHVKEVCRVCGALN